MTATCILHLRTENSMDIETEDILQILQVKVLRNL